VDREKAAKYAEEQDEIQKEAREKGEAKVSPARSFRAWSYDVSKRNRDRGDFGSNETQALLAGKYGYGRYWLRFPHARFCSTLSHARSGD
jgi:hypothetical protein